MLISITTKKRFKVIAMFLAVNLLAQIGFPTAAFALTSGPSQPEAGSFEPVNTNQMVDLFSGDFTYNIPLMNVPGPNGGYPINLAYHAGIGMEQEATWVGLGWNINAGVINRNLRGIPDDFKGDAIKKTVYMKPQRKISIGASAGINLELFGFDPSKGFKVNGSATVYYDNYKGVGMSYGLGLSASILSGEKGSMEGSLSINSDSKEGLGVSPSLSYSRECKKSAFKIETGANFNSRQGLKKLTFEMTRRAYEDITIPAIPLLNFKGASFRKWGTSGIGAGMSFSSSTYTPGLTMPQGGFGVSVSMKLGTNVAGASTSPVTVTASYNQTGISQNEVNFGAYGYLYEHKNNRGHSLADFNREKDIPVNKNSKSLPIPSATYDVYAVKGQGVGGAFRTYRSDIGVFKDPNIRGHTTGFQGGLEFNGGLGVKVGGNISLSYSTSYSGEWQTHDEEVTDRYARFGNTTDSDFEPAYFKALGETVPSNSMGTQTHNNNDDPFYFEMGMIWHWGSLSRVPVVRSRINSNGSGTEVTETPKADKRQKRVQSIQYLTNGELNGTTLNNTHPINGDAFSDYESVDNYNYQDQGAPHHIGDMSVINPDGNRYVYGLPAYNLTQKDVTFSVNYEDAPSNKFDRNRKYVNNQDNTKDNDEGLTNLYSKTEMPAYAHSYMLTEVLSPDYVDLLNDGPSEDDLGYWVKFNYIKKITPFNWRAPYGNGVDVDDFALGNNITGKLSNPMDDMSGYSYGEKEIKYLESIETKTHVAEYYMSKRLDGLGVIDENGGKDNAQQLLKLDSIVLKSKADINKAIKTVHFKYDYELCPNTLNSTASNQGKLTLKSVWFTYLDNSYKGALSPYRFSYAPGANALGQGGTLNPSVPYDLNKMDRWGNYQAEGPFKVVGGYISPNQNTPYCNQFEDYTTRDADASVWNLSQVIMPSGGVLNIGYESDDYAFVQNRPAKNMFKVLGTGRDAGSYDTDAPLSNDDELLFFELNKSMSQPELDACLAGIDQIYFKAYMKLKNQFQTLDQADDYVEGYFKLDGLPEEGINYGFKTNSTTKAWIKVKMVPPHQIIQSEIHPIKMAGLREIRFNRVDLLSGQNTGMGATNSILSIVAIVPTVINTMMDAMQMIIGFYNHGIMIGWCNKLVINDSTPSYIRLNTGDGIKYGGGCRVKRITLNDDWDELNSGAPNYENSEYGQEYTYLLLNGKSSGVAEYEPLIGGEENPFRRPVRYSSDRMFIKDDALMIEEPYNESLFPSANVGYSRVVVRNIKQHYIDGDDNEQEINKAISGITVNEFYTARDYPVYAENKTGVDYEGYNLTIPIPFIGSYSYHNNGYSQGFSIELNNMHGKPYSVATYAPTDYQAGAPGVTPVAATYYFYKTQGGFVRNKAGGNKLDNMVDVLSGDAIVTPMNIGKQLDTYVDMRENKTTTNSIGLAINIDYVPPFAVVPTIIPSISSAMSMFRSITTNKVITRNGILDKQVTTKEGARTVTQNLYYDGETGAPLLTTTTNDFDALIYDYSFAAHWEHEGMGGAYQNVGATVTNSSDLLHTGDELIDLDNGNNKIWLEKDGSFTDSIGTTVTPSNNLKIIRSGYRNQQSVSSGNIIALTNPADTNNRDYPLFSTINDIALGGNSNNLLNGGSSSFADCFDNSKYTISEISVCSNDNSRLKIKVPECTVNCDNWVQVDKGTRCQNGDFAVFIQNSDGWYCQSCIDECEEGFQGVEFNTSVISMNFSNLKLTKFGNKVKAFFPNSGADGTIIWGKLVGLDCLNECIPDVLHASAAKFKDSWNIDYADAGAIFDANHPVYPNQSVPNNTTRYGAESIWRLHKTYLFDIDRKQSDLLASLPNQTQSGVDGTYQNFALFNWDPAAINNLWTKTNTINQYSPYGYELENEDALGIKSAALYGYDNSVVTAVASNTAYKELAFDGFEDYGTATTLPLAIHTTNYGHFGLNAATLTTNESHTGDVSIDINSGSEIVFTNTVSPPPGKFLPKAGDDYYFSSWVKLEDITNTTAVLEIDGVQIKTTEPTEQRIEGWQRLEGKFTAGAGGYITIKIKANGGNVYFDDIRIQPFKSAMKTYVYNPKTLWLTAELDDRNYATFYNYDEEGNLVQIKKETKDGIRTIVSNRKNVKRDETITTP